MAYVVSARTSRGDETKELQSAAMARVWVDELRDRGAKIITIVMDGAFVAADYLPLLMEQEATARNDARDGEGA